MLEVLTPWSPKASVSEVITLDDLTIIFHRTIRVPDNKRSNSLPPNEGKFPLFQVKDYAGNLPLSMAQKGGMFIPMYQREALWIRFKSQKRYAIKIYVGDVNIVSGEPSVPTAATSLRRRHLLKEGKSIQDYIVVPDQKWIDGVAVEPGHVRQFVAIPTATECSIEAQMNREETTDGIQFEITRLDPPLSSGPEYNINVMVKGLNGETFNYFLSRFSKVEDLKLLIRARDGIEVGHQKLVWTSQHLQDEKKLSDYNLGNGALLYLFVRLRGGSSMPEQPEMNIAAGGLIRQNIVEEPKGPYRKSTTVTVNVQILNSATFSRVTGREPPPSPITARTYARYGYPFFSLDEGPATISGDFLGLKSLGQLEGRSERNVVGIPIVDVETGQVLREWICKTCKARNVSGMRVCKSCDRRRPALKRRNKIGLLNPEGPKTPFQFSSEIAEELNKKLTLF
ncbi:uncharacterized protein BKA55DRAFT_686016 [Fusarium redolens]|uniref:Ubiquitin-like domain-containing protein n=1 Tax=Fusarium redolens TaxID=48865 RepID=A0A9P9HXW5_FUSRE|nr:uncharacterized protein BKA55DRAFT_686016 [Fusarium redolens]KAH7265550.1 hypothetical protein BKA55DRAFT_686016 [Fusarium redolens]